MAGTNGAAEPAEVFDLDALERDTTPVPFRFTAGGQTFDLAGPSDLDWHALPTFQEGRVDQVLPHLLGDQFDAFDQLDIPGWKLDQLLTAWGRHNGIDLGESQASSTSSAGTVRPSRRTSGGSTASGSRTSRRGR
jgi:hypothetical protein